MKIRSTKHRRLWVLISALAVNSGLSACKKDAKGQASNSAASTPNLAMPAQAPAAQGPDRDARNLLEQHLAGNPNKEERLREFDQENAKLDVAEKLAKENREQMVSAAPPGFHSAAVGAKVQLGVSLEKPMIRVGESPSFRLKMTNVGGQPVDYEEYSASVFKTGNFADSALKIRFYITDPKGVRTKLRSPMIRTAQGGAIAPKNSGNIEYLPDSMPKSEQERRLTDNAAASEAASHFVVQLRPGETLTSLGDDGTTSTFRTVFSTSKFTVPGVYRVQVELDDRPEPLSKAYIDFSLKSGSTLKQIQADYSERVSKALGPVSSNLVTFEVTK